MFLIPNLAVNGPRGRNLSHSHDVSAVKNERQVSAYVMDIGGLQHCGMMSAPLGVEAWTDVRGGPNVTRRAETGMIQRCRKNGGWKRRDRQVKKRGRRDTWTESGSNRTNEGRAAAEMIMIGTTNGVFICTARNNPPGGEKEE